MIKREIFAIALAAAMLPTLAHSQSVPLLSTSTDARTEALGGATVASEANAFAIYNNPASIALSEDSFSIGGSYNMLQSAGVKSGNIVSVATYGKVSDKIGVALAYRSHSKEAYDIIDNNADLIGEFTPSDMAIDAALAYAITPNLAIGATIKYISSKLATDYSGKAVSGDIAAIYRLDRTRVALSLSNIGSIKYDTHSYSLPTVVRAGGEYDIAKRGDHNCTASIEASYLTPASALAIGAGAEYSYRKLLFARLGYFKSLKEAALASHLSAGVGVEIFNISLDCSHIIDNSPLVGCTLLTLGYRF